MTATWRRIIAAVEIVGGISGIVLLALELAHVPFNAATLLIAMLVLLMYSLSLVAGVLLWREHKWGRLLSIIVQAIQLPKLITPILIFNLCFGFDFYLYLMVSNYGFFGFGFELKLLAFYQLHIGVPIPAVGFGVSIPACIFLTALIRDRKEREPHEHFYVPPPTDPRYWSAPPAPDTVQDQFGQQSPPPPGADDHDASGKLQDP